MAKNSKCSGVDDSSDVLVTRGSICAFLGIGEATYEKWKREYDDFPVTTDGRVRSSKKALNEWNYWFISQKRI